MVNDTEQRDAVLDHLSDRVLKGDIRAANELAMETRRDLEARAAARRRRKIRTFAVGVGVTLTAVGAIYVWRAKSRPRKPRLRLVQ